MANELQPFVDLLPASGTIAFDAWKQAIVQSHGRPLSNRQFNALRKQHVSMSTDPVTGQLMVGRKPGGTV